MFVRMTLAEAEERGLESLVEMVEEEDAAIHVVTPGGWVAIVAPERIESLVRASRELAELRKGRSRDQ